jgi:hypothetical protein
MGIVSRSADTFYTYRFIKLLTTPWEDTEAYEYGIVDENGKVLRKARTLRSSEEKDAYTLFHRLVFNVKRLLEKLPLGRRRLASYAAALFLLREEVGMSDEQVEYALEKMGIDLEDDTDTLDESAAWFKLEDGSIAPGVYSLVSEVASPHTGETIGHPGDSVVIDEQTHSHGSVLGHPIYRVTHTSSKQILYVCAEDIDR